jgi:DNA-binding beta-propeller fold protein YncE
MHYQRPDVVAGFVPILMVIAIVAAVALAWMARRCVSLVVTILALLPMLAACGREPEPAPRPAWCADARIVGRGGKGPLQFNYPRAMAWTPSGELIIVDRSARVQVLGPDGSYRREWMMPEFDQGFPTGVSVSAAGDVWIADTHEHRITVMDDKGRVLRTFGGFGQEPGRFVFPTDIAFGEDGLVYVSEYGGTDRISIFEPSPTGDDSTKPAFTCVATFGRFGSSSDPAQVEFSRPQSMVIDARAAELIVADACNHRIGRFHLDGRLIAWIGSPDSAGKGLGQFSYPYGLALLEDRTVLVAEYGNNRIQQVDLDTGKGVRTFGQPGRGSGQLAIPWGIAAIGSTAYVLDSGNNRVMGFDAPRPARRLALDPDRVKGDG